MTRTRERRSGCGTLMTNTSHTTAAESATEPGTLSPPVSFMRRLRFIGPSLILTGGVVGSGELIVTTTLGAEMGFIALWLIIISCVLKVVVQEEIGRYAISSGETSLHAVNHVPGPRWKVSWVVWGWLIMTVMVAVQVAGIVRGVGQALNHLIPGIGVIPWGLLMCFLTVALLLGGRYGVVERTATILVVGFTLTTIISAVFIQRSPHAIRIEEILEGLQFQLPSHGLIVALAVFGITGIGTTELFFYPSWCVEKGYARFTGPNRPEPGWVSRAVGWVRVMQLDAIAAMILYTSATIAFYLLGAGVLHRMGLIPEGEGMIKVLSATFTETIGPGALLIFLIGAFFVLYSTLFVSVASSALLAVDCMGVFRALDLRDPKQVLRWRRGFILIFTALNILFSVLIAAPVKMVVVGGIAQTAMLPIIAFSVVYLRHRRLDKRLLPSRWVDVLLWTCSSLMLIISLYTILRKIWE